MQTYQMTTRPEKTISFYNTNKYCTPYTLIATEYLTRVKSCIRHKNLKNLQLYHWEKNLLFVATSSPITNYPKNKSYIMLNNSKSSRKKNLNSSIDYYNTRYLFYLKGMS